jgi:hypothetical protein
MLGACVLTALARRGMLWSACAIRIYEVAGFTIASVPVAEIRALGRGIGCWLRRPGVLDSASDCPCRGGEATVPAIRPRSVHPKGEAQSVRAVRHGARSAHSGQGRRAVSVLGRSVREFPTPLPARPSLGIRGGPRHQTVRARADEQGLYPQFFRSGREILDQRAAGKTRQTPRVAHRPRPRSPISRRASPSNASSAPSI